MCGIFTVSHDETQHLSIRRANRRKESGIKACRSLGQSVVKRHMSHPVTGNRPDAELRLVLAGTSLWNPGSLEIWPGNPEAIYIPCSVEPSN